MKNIFIKLLGIHYEAKLALTTIALFIVMIIISLDYVGLIKLTQ